MYEHQRLYEHPQTNILNELWISLAPRMIKFADVVAIEEHRREIERLTHRLERAASIEKFVGKTYSLPDWEVSNEFRNLIREALCKSITAEIIKLLGECHKLGVDITESEQKLQEFLEQLKGGTNEVSSSPPIP